MAPRANDKQTGGADLLLLVSVWRKQIAENETSRNDDDGAGS